MSSAALSATELVKRYGEKQVVSDVTLEVHPAEVVGLLGPNGAGKTTTLESLEGLRAPDGGTLRVAGVDPTREPHKLRNLIGVQLQSAGLPESITPDEAMKFFCAYHSVAPRFDLLERLGLEVHTAGSGEAALTLMDEMRFQAILMDEQMPGMDGLEATRRIRGRAGDDATTPVVALTANTDKESERRCLAAGMDGFLGKPVRRKAIRALLSRWLPEMLDAPERALRG